MSFLGGIGDIIEDIGGGVIDIGEGVIDIGADVIQGVEASVKGALTGDPIAIASLALTAYSGYSLYTSFAAAGAGASTVATTTATTTASTTASTTAASVSQQSLASLSNDAFADAVLKSAEQGTNPVFSEVAKQQAKATLQETVTQATLETGTDIAEQSLGDLIFEGAKAIGESAGKQALFTAATGFLAEPEVTLPTFEPRAVSETFDATPDYQIGASSTSSTGSTQRTTDEFSNINVLGRLS